MRSIRTAVVIIGLGLVVIVATASAHVGTRIAEHLSASDTRVSPEAQHALMVIAQREQIPPQNLRVVHDFQRPAPLLSRSFQAVVLLDQQSGRIFTSSG